MTPDGAAQRSGKASMTGGMSARLAALPAVVRQHAPVRIPTWQELSAGPETMRRVLNLWPPFLFAGIRVRSIEAGFTGATVELRLHPLSRNYMGTQFGGSMFSMVDPFWVILVTQRLGPGYVVWDKQAHIDFVSPGRTHVTATIAVPDELIEAIRARAADGSKVLEWVETEIRATDGTLVATVRRQLYVRRAKPRSTS